MDIRIPEVGESIVEATIAKWHKKEGDRVAKDDLLCEVETDKITLEIHAEADGVLSIKAEEGKTLKVGSIIAVLQEGTGSRKPAAESKAQTSAPKPAAETKQAAPRKEMPKAKEEKPVPAPTKSAKAPTAKSISAPEKAKSKAPSPTPPAPAKLEPSAAEEKVTRRPMSAIRRKIAERLLAARQQTAMVTTFNEADMSRIVELRQRYRDSFKERHGVKLGLLPFFLKACAEALREFPELNAKIDGEDIVYQHFYDIGIAVAAEKGLLVPVIRDVARKDFAELGKIIEDFSARAKVSRIELSELEGGTFSITNGGTYGSLLSTPLLNPPQSAILGLHAIQERPVVRNGEVVVRPMMNLALSYDHRLVDGRQAVEFLVRIKTLIEEPEEMLLEL